MGSSGCTYYALLLYTLIGWCALNQCCGIGVETNLTAQLSVNASKVSARQIPQNLYGIFFEVIFLLTLTTYPIFSFHFIFL